MFVLIVDRRGEGKGEGKRGEGEEKLSRKKWGRKMVDQLTVIEIRIGDERFGGWTFEAGISGSGGVANALQVVMPEGRTPGRHDGRDAEVRRFSPFPFRRHPFSPPTTHFDSLDFSLALSLLFFLSFHTVLFLPLLFFASSLYLSSRSLSLSFLSFLPSLFPSHPPSLPPPSSLSPSVPLSLSLFLSLVFFLSLSSVLHQRARSLRLSFAVRSSNHNSLTRD